MASPAFRSAGDHPTGTTSITFTEPAGAADGDIIVVNVYAEKDADTTTLDVIPAGFTEWVRGTNTGSAPDIHQYVLWWRKSGAKTYTFGKTGAAFMTGSIIAVSGAVGSGDPGDVVGVMATGNSATLTANSVTTLTADTLLCYFGASFNGSGFTADGAMVERDDSLSTEVATQAIAAIGATGTRAATTGSDFWTAVMVAIASTAGGAAGVTGGPLRRPFTPKETGPRTKRPLGPADFTVSQPQPVLPGSAFRPSRPPQQDGAPYNFRPFVPGEFTVKQIIEVQPGAETPFHKTPRMRGPRQFRALVLDRTVPARRLETFDPAAIPFKRTPRMLGPRRFRPLVQQEQPALGAINVVPATASLVLTAFVPTVLTPRLVTPGTASLVLTTFAPSVILGTRVVPGTASLVLATFAPSVATPRLVTPGTAALVLSGKAPSVIIGTIITPGTASLVLSGKAPTVTTTGVVTPGTAALVLTVFAPTVSAGGGAAEAMVSRYRRTMR